MSFSFVTLRFDYEGTELVLWTKFSDWNSKEEIYEILFEISQTFY